MVTTGTNNQIFGSALLRMRDKIFVTGRVKTEETHFKCFN